MLPSFYEIYIFVHLRTVSNLYADMPYQRGRTSGDSFMLDLAMVGLGVGFFVVSILYTTACNHL